MAELCLTLEREAAAERDHLLGDARAEAERIRSQAEARRLEDRARELAAADVAARAAAESRLAAARRSARRRSLEAQQLLVDRVLAAATLLLPTAAARPQVLRALVDAALAYADGPVILRCPPALAGAVRSHVEGKPEITVEADGDARSGVSAILYGGTVSVDATLEGRLERARPGMAIDIVRRLDDVG
jgi:vacuolar-type H+-ATPase subunit E/Vma4